MDYLLLGYVFILQERDADWVPDPPPVCPCSTMYRVVPDDECIEWAAGPEMPVLPDRLGLDRDTWRALQTFCGEAFEESLDFAVIYDRKTACTLRDKFLKSVPNLRLIGIYLRADQADTYEKKAPNANPGYHFQRVLRRRQPYSDDPEEVVLGFDVLYTSGGMDLHSPHCSPLASQLAEQGLARNDEGLYQTEGDMTAALTILQERDGTDLQEQDGTDFTPVWFPCLITEVLR